MTLQQLEYVVAVAEHRHFLKAAEACDVTQPTLSSMVQKLEEELGVKIFNRRIKPIALTPVGEPIVAQARQTLAQAQRLKACVDEAQHTPRGTFSIAVLPTIAPYLIPRFYPEFSRRYPDVELHITEMKTICEKYPCGCSTKGIVSVINSCSIVNSSRDVAVSGRITWAASKLSCAWWRTVWG